MAYYWKITTQTDFNHGHEIVDQNACLSFLLRDTAELRNKPAPAWDTLSAWKNKCKVLAWHKSNEITVTTTHNGAIMTSKSWALGRIDIYSVDGIVTRFFDPDDLTPA